MRHPEESAQAEGQFEVSTEIVVVERLVEPIPVPEDDAAHPTIYIDNYSRSGGVLSLGTLEFANRVQTVSDRLRHLLLQLVGPPYLPLSSCSQRRVGICRRSASHHLLAHKHILTHRSLVPWTCLELTLMLGHRFLMLKLHRLLQFRLT